VIFEERKMKLTWLSKIKAKMCINESRYNYKWMRFSNMEYLLEKLGDRQ